MKAKWSFTAVDNGGKRHAYTVTASTKDEAIRKGMEKARKNAKGDILPTWQCKLLPNV